MSIIFSCVSCVYRLSGMSGLSGLSHQSGLSHRSGLSRLSTSRKLIDLIKPPTCMCKEVGGYLTRCARIAASNTLNDKSSVSHCKGLYRAVRAAKKDEKKPSTKPIVNSHAFLLYFCRVQNPNRV